MINNIIHRLKQVETVLNSITISAAPEFKPCNKSGTDLFWNTVHLCVRPDKKIDNTECENDPYCNCPECPGQTGDNSIKPTGQKPSTGTLRWALKQTSDDKVYKSIKEKLGKEYLGCEWNRPWSSLNCTCPCWGDKFEEYLDTITTKATFWDTPQITPLWRTAQMGLINSQVAIMGIDGDLSLRPGTIVNIVDVVPVADSGEVNKKFGGNWLVTGIDHIIPNAMNHNMVLTLQRDSVPVAPEDHEDMSEDSFFNWLFGV